jgi:DNA-binding NarL/FixJ family response regulator
VRLN